MRGNKVLYLLGTFYFKLNFILTLMIKKIVLSLITVLSFCSLAIAQNKQVTGTVTDVQGEPILGATVVAEGTTSGTTTDIDGRFALMVPADGSIVVSFIGYETKHVSVVGMTNVNVTLKEASEIIDEIVVVGYGSGKKISSVIGQVDQVKSDKIENRPSNNVADALQGQVAGLQIMTGSGEMNQTSSIRIHGIGSINAGTSPLILLDGAPISSSTLLALNQNDIAAINVLKDAAATSIYGSRAANGVIYVTTKTGRRNQGEDVEVTLRAQYAMTSAIDPRITPMNSEEFLNYRAASAVADKYGVYSPNNRNYNTYLNIERQKLISQYNIDMDTNVNWWDEIFEKNAPMYQVDLSVSGGSAKTAYYFSGNFSDETGILPGSASQRYTFRTNVDTKVNNWLRVGLNLGMGYTGASTADTDSTTGGLYVSNPVIAALITPSYQPLYDKETGEMLNFLTQTSAVNPLLTPYYMPRGSSRLQLNGSGYVELTPVKGLTIRSSLSADGFDWQPWSKTSPLTPSPTGGIFGSGSDTELYQRLYSWTWTNTAEYKFTLNDKHNFTALLGEETIYNSNTSTSFTVIGITSSDYINPSMGSEVSALPSYGISQSASNSVFGHLEYNFDERYFFDVTLRNDASSRFAKEKRNAFFYSVGAKWNVKRESFLRDNETISDLGLSVSYGTQGNSDIGSYAYLRYLGASSAYDGTTTWALAALGDPNLTWEKQSILSVNLDIQLWKKLRVELGYYRRQTTDMLFSIPLAPSSGFSARAGNIGAMRNSGVDVTINYDIYNTKDWYINFRTTFNYNKNQVTKLWDPSLKTVSMGNGLYAWSVGDPYPTWEMPQWMGVDPNSGLDTWVSLDGGITTDFNNAAYVNQGTSNIAPYTGGFSITAQWKGLALSADFSWVAGNYVYNNTMYFLANGPVALNNGFNACTEAFDYWKEPGDATKYPRLDQDIQFDTRMLEKGDFMRLKNLQLSYSLPTHILQKTKFIKGLKVWIGGRNLWTVTGYNGLDPEAAEMGVDVDVYPNTRQITFGLEFKF